jgi:hypothetical protein
MKTKISLVLLGLGLVSGSAFAAHADEMPMPVSNDINVTAPDQSGMWSFGATAVLMQPTNKAFNYADTSNTLANGTQLTADTNHKTVDTNYLWWFGADVAYAFPGNGRDVTLAYEGLHGTTTGHATGDALVDASNTGATVLNSTFGDENAYLTGEGESKTNYDAGDLVFGQKLDVGTRIRLHPFMGLRYAHINTQDTGTYGNGADDNTVGDNAIAGASYTTETSKLENTFNGIGPRFGSDAQINLGQGFSVRGRLGMSALIGSRSVDNSTVLTGYDDSDVAVGTASASNDNNSQTHVVPEIDGRLGLNYTYNMNSGMAVGFEAGWQATNYFNVVADGSSINQHEDNTNFGIQGPYARVQLDVA